MKRERKDESPTMRNKERKGRKVKMEREESQTGSGI